MEKKYDIFISYSRKDLNTVHPIVNELDARDFKVWLDLSEIDYGETFPDRIAEALDASDSILFMCTPNSLAAQYCKKEIGYARANGKKIRAILVDGIMPKKGWFALDYQDVNCINITKDEQKRKFYEDIESEYQPEKAAERARKIEEAKEAIRRKVREEEMKRIQEAKQRAREEELARFRRREEDERIQKETAERTRIKAEEKARKVAKEKAREEARAKAEAERKERERLRRREARKRANYNTSKVATRSTEESEIWESYDKKMRNKVILLIIVISGMLFIACLIPNSENKERLETQSSYSQMSDNTNDNVIPIDLGLPSGTLWADRNIGALEPKDDGCHYAFGAIESLVEYPESTGNEFVDGESIIGTKRDIARLRLGKDWQMPSRVQMDELVKYCKYNLEDNGYRFTGINGNSIFLPFTEPVSEYCVMSIGYYWSGNKGYILEFQSEPDQNYEPFIDFPFASNIGLSIRAVKTPQ